MKVLYFHQHFSTPKGKTGTRSYEMARRLLEDGHEVTMVCGSYGAGLTELTGPFKSGIRRGEVDGIDLLEFDLAYSNSDGVFKRAVTFVKFGLGSIRIALREPYDVLFATSTPLTAGIPGIFAHIFRRKPFVFEVRDLWPELPREMGAIKNPFILTMLSALEWASYRSADRCIALSPGIAEGIARRGIAREDITLVPNGCDMGLFADPDVVAVRPPVVPENDLMAIFTGTHGQANGLHAVVDAAAELQSRGRDDIKIVLIGDGKLKGELRKSVTDQQLRNVIFLPPVSKIELVGIMGGADIGLQCLANVPAFYYGTSPNKFFDYIAAGLPVLNNYPGWLADMIVENNCGYAVQPEDAAAFADALEHAADNRDELLGMGQRARKLAFREFSRNDLAEKWVSAVLSVSKGS